MLNNFIECIRGHFNRELTEKTLIDSGWQKEITIHNHLGCNNTALVILMREDTQNLWLTKWLWLKSFGADMKEWNFFPFFFFSLASPEKLLNFLKVQEKMRWYYCRKHLKSKHSSPEEIPSCMDSLKTLNGESCFQIYSKYNFCLNKLLRIHPQTVRPRAFSFRNI